MHTETGHMSRRAMIGTAAASAAALAATGLLSACGAPNNETGGGAAATVLDPKTDIDYKTATNFSIVPESTTKVGTTAENLKTAITGETGATTKYEAFSAAAESAGYAQIARLFQCTADAEKIHIALEFAELQRIEPNAAKPEPPRVQAHETDINLILGATGEIYETSDMYPSFIKAAIAEGDDVAAQVFSRAKLAEAFHAELYMQAYTFIDQPDDDSFYLCPVCGYIHKGENFTACPICLSKKASFTAY
jgi:rubrerythrin